MYTGARMSGTKLSQSALNYLKTLEKSSKELRQTTGSSTSDVSHRQSVQKKTDRRESFSSVLSQIRSHENNTSFDSDDFASIDKMSTIIDSDEDESTRGERVVLDLNFDPLPNTSKLPRWKPDHQVGRKSIAEIRELRNSIDKSLQPPPLMEKKAHRSVFRAANSFGDIEEVTTEESGRSMEEQISGKAVAQIVSSNKKSPFKTAVESGSSDLESIDFEVPSELPERISGERRVSFKEPVSSSNDTSNSSGSTSSSASSRSESESSRSSTKSSTSGSSNSKQSSSTKSSSRSSEKSEDSDPGSSGFESSESSSSTVKADIASELEQPSSPTSNSELVKKKELKSRKTSVIPKTQQTDPGEATKSERKSPDKPTLQLEPVKQQSSNHSSTPENDSENEYTPPKQPSSRNSKNSSRKSSETSLKDEKRQSVSEEFQRESKSRSKPITHDYSSDISSDEARIDLRKTRRSSFRSSGSPSRIPHRPDLSRNRRSSQDDRKYSKELRRNSLKTKNTATISIQTETMDRPWLGRIANHNNHETCCPNAPQIIRNLMESQLNQLRDLASIQMNAVLQNERFVQEIKASYEGPNTEKLIKLIEERSLKYKNTFTYK